MKNILSDNNRKDEIQELEEGEIVEDNTVMVKSTEQIIQPEVSKGKHVEKSIKRTDYEWLWETEQRSHLHEQMFLAPSTKPFIGLKKRPAWDRFPKGDMMKRVSAGYLMGDEKLLREKRKFDQNEKKNTVSRNQHGMFRRQNNDTAAKSFEGVDEVYIKRNSPDILKFEKLTREFENGGEDFRIFKENNFISKSGRGEKRGGCDTDQGGKDVIKKRRTDVFMENKRFDNEEKISPYFHQVKCLKIDLNQITINEDMVKLLNSLKTVGSGDESTKVQPSPFYLPPGEQLYNLEETVQENNSIAVETGKSDVCQLPFRFPVEIATEIYASLNSHPPMEYKLYPIEVSKTGYSKILPTMGVDDPRLRRSITVARSFLR